MPIALGYGRKSVVRSGVDTISVDKQRLAVAELADRRGEPLEWYEDAEGHRSGRSERTRPAWQRLLARVESDNAVASVIVYELDRAGRSVVLIDKLLKLCAGRHVAFIAIRDGIDTTRGAGANEITRIQLLAVLAEGEANRVSERMSDTARYYREVLHMPWGMWPFGVTRSGEGDAAQFRPDPPHDDTVRRLFSTYLNGNGYTETSVALNRAGLSHINRYGRPKEFNVETVRTIIGNVLFYAGYAVGVRFKAKQATIQLAGEGTFLERYATAMKATRNPAITPLITEEMANAVIERRSRNLWTGRKGQEWVALLTPIATWRGMKLRAQCKDHGHFYRTRGRQGARFDGDAIDTELVRRLTQTHFPDAVRADIRHQIEERTGNARRVELGRQEARLLGEMGLLIDLLHDEMIDRELYNVRFVKVERQLADVRLQMREPDNVDQLISVLNSLAESMMIFSAPKRRQLLQHVFEEVQIGDDGQIVHLIGREWARAAFTALAQTVPIVPPVSDDHDSGTAWVLRRVA